MKNSLCIFSYNSSGTLENLTLNISTIMLMLWDKNIHNLNNDANLIYNKFYNNGLLYFDSIKLSSFLNKNWYKIEEWWYSESIQLIVKEFYLKYLRKENQSMRKLSNKLKKIF